MTMASRLAIPVLLALLISTSVVSSTYPYDVANVILYGYPLALYVQTYYPALKEVGPNALRNDQKTSTSVLASLVRPNANCVYTDMAIDLSTEDVVITIPNITDGRSFVYPFYDVYGEMVAALGSATKSPPGDYILRPASKSRKPGLTLLDADDYVPDFPYQGIIDFPGAYGSMSARLLLRNNGSDLDTLRGYQNETRVRTVSREGTPLAPRLTTSLFGNGSLASASYSNPRALSPSNATGILSLLAKIAPHNPPLDDCNAFQVEAMLEGSGIVNGSYVGNDFDQQAVSTLIVENLNRTYPQNDIYWNDLGHDWWIYKSYISGQFNQAYGVRAETAYVGYLDMSYAEALYPEYLTPSGTGLSLSANESYILTFASRPPAQFWSVTLYNSENYLVPNSLERYALGCTDESITYPNGTKVYPTGQHNDQYFLGSEGEEPFQVLVQPADKAPPGKWTGNWLPAPAGGGGFMITFRTYGPSPALTNGTYVYPAVSKQGVIV